MQIATLVNDTRPIFLSKQISKDINFDAEAGFAIQALSTDYAISIALGNPQAVIDAVTNVAAIGISLNPAKKQAYLVPRDKKICLDISYMGLIDLAVATGSILWAQCIIVHADDDFALQGFDKPPHHKFNPFSKERGEIVGAYACVKTPTGDYLTHAMPISDILAIRDRSQTWKSGKASPWKSDEGEMIKKGLAIDTPIPTTSGWVTMQNIEVGTDVFDMYGQVVTVKAVSEIKHLQCFKIRFQNGEEIVCDNEHRWVARCGGSKAYKKAYSVMTINEMFDAKERGLSVTVPVQGQLQTEAVDLLVDPYLLGYWLGDGTSLRAQITCSEDDVEHVISAISNTKYKVGALRPDPRSKACSLGIVSGFLNDLRSIGVLGNKHVPVQYMRGSIEQRKQLLAGLLDSDGHVDIPRGKVHFYNKNEKLSQAVHELAASLGEVPNIKIRNMRGYGVDTVTHWVQWQPSFAPCIMLRKAANFKSRRLARYRAITRIEIVPTVPTRCIAVTGVSETFLAGIGMTPTHNTVVKQAYKYWPKTSPQLENAIHYLNTETNEGLAELSTPQLTAPARMPQRKQKEVPTDIDGKTGEVIKPKQDLGAVSIGEIAYIRKKISAKGLNEQEFCAEHNVADLDAINKDQWIVLKEAL